MAGSIAVWLVAAAAAVGAVLPAFAAQEIPDGQMPAPDTPADALYRCVTVVTGTRIETRRPGFAECLGTALVKVTGDQTILKDRRLARAARHAEDDVARFSYHDRLSGRPVHDEQGTHDRPHDLTVDFDRARIDALAQRLGREPWPTPRPRVLVLLAVENIRHAFILTRDGTIDRSADMREAFAAAAEKAALPPVTFPTEARIAARGWTYRTLPDVALDDAQALAREAAADATVVGHIVFSEKALGWIVDWRMVWRGRTYRWATRGVTFDAAFRHALFGAAQVMAGRGAPR
jgi:hypothetical protein